MRMRRVVQHAQNPRQALLHRRAACGELPDKAVDYGGAVDQPADRSKGCRSRLLYGRALAPEAGVHNAAPVGDTALGVLCLGE